jgi:cyclic beta-1,2-glucan synthetase
MATTKERAFQLADRYQDPRAAQRAFDLAWASTQVELRELGITPNEAAGFQEIAGHLLYTSHGLSAKPEDRARNRGSQPLLWSIGISGDRPILLATIDYDAALPTLRQLFTAHHYWRRRGLHIDLVVLNEHAPTYLNELDEEIKAALAASRDAGVVEQPGGVFLRRSHELADDALLMLRATARVHIRCDGRSLRRILRSSRVPKDADVGAAGERAAPAGAASQAATHASCTRLLGTDAERGESANAAPYGRAGTGHRPTGF